MALVRLPLLVRTFPIALGVMNFFFTPPEEHPYQGKGKVRRGYKRSPKHEARRLARRAMQQESRWRNR